MTFLSSLCSPMTICIHCRKWYQESFHQNRLPWYSSTSSLLYSPNLFIYVFFLSFLSLLTFFFSSRPLGTFFHGFRIPFPFPFPFPDSGFRIPDSGFHVLVLPHSPSFATVIPVQGNFQSKFYEMMNIRIWHIFTVGWGPYNLGYIKLATFMWKNLDA